ncbi:cytochrome b5-like [Galleria mellonella]|uniref:Cytochrome b5 n=1 Tax=Galleria mellonella TaxID=7137 RepID=A0A6J1WRU3_GALME|nr:cytochrome b5-like [Galleria mellonella]
MSQNKFTRKEIEGRNRRGDAAFVIDNVVYDVTRFLQEHPGGAEVLLDHAGGDASRGFHDVGHSEEARQLMAQYAVGEVVQHNRRRGGVASTDEASASDEGARTASLLATLGPPLALAAVAILLYLFLL